MNYKNIVWGIIYLISSLFILNYFENLYTATDGLSNLTFKGFLFYLFTFQILLYLAGCIARSFFGTGDDIYRKELFEECREVIQQMKEEEEQEKKQPFTFKTFKCTLGFHDMEKIKENSFSDDFQCKECKKQSCIIHTP